MKFDFDKVINRQDGFSLKWTKYPKDVLPLWVADMDFRAPEPVIDAIRERVEHGVFGYAPQPRDLAEVIQVRMKHLYNWDIKVEDILFVPGVMSGVTATARAIGSPGGSVLIQTPVYYPFLDVGKDSKKNLNCSELVNDQGEYQVNFDEFEEHFTQRTKLFLLCNPHNPIGKVFKKEELEKMAEICLDNNTIICSDEIHSDLVYAPHKHIPIATLSPEVANSTVTVIAPSKTFNIPGLASSILIVQNKKIRNKIKEVLSGIVSGINLLGYAASLAAYQKSGDWQKAVLSYLEGNRDYILQEIKAHFPNIKMRSPSATYLAWLDCKSLDVPGDPCDFFLKKAKVGLSNGKTFGKGGEGFLRLNYGCPRSTLKEAFQRMKNALDQR